MTNEILTYVMGGGLISLLIGLLTLNAKVKKATADTESLELDNTDKATRILMENIVKPLRIELDDTRKEFAETKMEMERLRKAINSAKCCPHTDHCPVLRQLRHSPGDPSTAGGTASRIKNGSSARDGPDRSAGE